MMLMAMTFALVSMAQLPKSAITLSGGGQLGLEKGGNNWFAVSAGTIHNLTGAVYLQPRLSFVAADASALSLSAVPSLQLKSWGSASAYAGFGVSATFSSGETYVQYTPELGLVCALGKNALALTRLNYDLKDNTGKVVTLSFGLGWRL